jgi:hypothetical protein
MRADVEDEITRPHERCIEPVHGEAPPAIAVVDAQGAQDSTCGPQPRDHGMVLLPTVVSYKLVPQQSVRAEER